MQRGEVWFAQAPHGDRPVLGLIRDPVADRVGAVMVAVPTRTRRGRQPIVTRRHTDTDGPLAEEARPVIGTATTKDTMNAALLQAVDRELRLRHVRRLADLDGIDLADEEIMAGTRR